MALELGMYKADRVADIMTNDVIKNELIPAYRGSLDEVRKEVATFYERYAVDGKLEMADVARYNRLANLEKNIAAEMKALGAKQIGRTTKHIKQVYQETYYRSAFAYNQELGIDLQFGLLPAEQVKAAAVSPFGWEQSVQESMGTAIRQIRQEMISGIIQGKSYPDTARKLAERIGVSQKRAERIIRTESHRAQEMGKVAMMEDAHKKGVRSRKQWRAYLDDVTRQTHGVLDGQVVDFIDEEGNPGLFQSPAGHTAEFPGGFGVAEEDINCRCRVVAVHRGFGPEFRRTKYDGIIPYETYSAYATRRGWPTYFEPARKVMSLKYPKKGFGNYTDAEMWAENKYQNTSFDLRGIELRNLNTTLRQYDKMAMRYPYVAKDIKYVGTGLNPHKMQKAGVKVRFSEEWAHAGRTARWEPKQIGLNPASYGNRKLFQKELAQGYKYNYHPAKSTASVMTHEFGHQVYNWHMWKSQYAVAPYYDMDTGAGFAIKMLHKFTKKHTPQHYAKRAAKEGNFSLNVPEALGHYAMENEREIWAEAFAARHHGSATAKAHPYVKYQAELLSVISPEKQVIGAENVGSLTDTERRQANKLLRALMKRIGL